MKLFQQMLVASTALSLIAPIGAEASDYNIKGMNSYSNSKNTKNAKRFSSKLFSSELATNEKKVESSDVISNQFEAGSFSETTTMDGKAIFYVGSVETEDDLYTGEVTANYTYQMNVNTSFSGDDNLYVRLKSGNADNWSDIKTEHNTYLSAASGKDDDFDVDKIWYSTPLGENTTLWLGPKIENYYMHATTPSIYKSVLKAFTLGGNAAAYGASTSPGAGLSYNFDNGFALSTNFTTQGGNGSTGMLTDEGMTSWATQVGYTQPQYSVSAIVNMKYNEWEDGYYQTTLGTDRSFNDQGSVNIGLRAWWRPEETGTIVPSVSLGYDTSETDRDENDGTDAYFVGLNWQDAFTADDRIGIAFGQPQKRDGDTVDPFLYEIYYDYKVNDSITVTPAIFGGTANDGGTGTEATMTGYVLNTTFTF